MVRFGTNLYAGTGSGVYLSTDNGISWTAASDGLTDTNVISLAVSGTNLFAGCFMYGKYDGNMFLSTDNGVSWNLANTGLTSLVNALAVSGTNLSLGAGGGVSISTNRDGTWTPVNIALTSLMFRLLQSAVQISLPGLTETISLHDDRCD
jgi:ligand-binding sensor domain-containing protein